MLGVGAAGMTRQHRKETVTKGERRTEVKIGEEEAKCFKYEEEEEEE